jgi:hypothetical protein
LGSESIVQEVRTKFQNLFKEGTSLQTWICGGGSGERERGMLSGGFTLIFRTSITTHIPKEGVGLVLIFFEIWNCGGGKERWHFFWDQRNEVKSQKEVKPNPTPKRSEEGTSFEI